MTRKNEARMERIKQRADSGLMSKHFPKVASIVINMSYKQKGVAKPILRTLNFYPSSYAFFRVDCLSDDCIDGGFDLTKIISSMIKSSRQTVKGELGCESGSPSAEHSAITYEVAIKYVK